MKNEQKTMYISRGMKSLRLFLTQINETEEKSRSQDTNFVITNSTSHQIFNHQDP